MFSSGILNFDKIKQVSAKYPKDPTLIYQYGTAGFRYKNDILDPVLFRVGIVAVVRSKFLGGKTIGIMITASHNPEIDNGVKIVDPMGEMLATEWEQYATDLTNVNSDLVAAKCAKLFAELKIDHSAPSNVVIARDTRPSGPRLVRAVMEGIQSVQGQFKDFGEMTTPQLHYIVRCLNTMKSKQPYGQPTEDGYYDKTMKAYEKITAHLKDKKASVVNVDCANGVGALKMEKLLKLFPDLKTLNVNLLNVDVRAQGLLNSKCGADFVKVDQKLPQGVTADQANQRCASFDGDADRIVYFYENSSGKFTLLDGDKIAALAAGFIKEQLVNVPSLKGQIEVGVVQTAYANGSSTKYFEQRGIPVAFTCTGVKHLHHRAEEFDVGVYFEANGHGTVLFNQKYFDALAKVDPKSFSDDSQSKSFEILQTLPELINQTVGDAISDMLMVEAILACRNWTLADWSNMYSDLPNRQLKVKVKDRSIFQTTDADRQLTSPAGLQAIIDSEVKNVESGRSFVRPSGTEDVVRVYAEASSQELCDKLAYTIAGVVYEKGGGVGEKPVLK